MAINKSIQTRVGVAATYHRVTSFQVLIDCNAVVAQIGSYLSQQARQSGNSPLQSTEMSVPISDFTVDPRPAIYTSIAPVEIAPAGDGVNQLISTSPFAGGTKI